MKITINMNYIKSLLELIKSKKEISEDNTISLSLGEIADAWNRNVIRNDPLGISGLKSIDYDFLQDVFSALRKFKDEKLIEFKYIISDYFNLLVPKESYYKKQSISDIVHLSSLQDKIFLEVKERFDNYLPKTEVKEAKKFFLQTPPDTRWKDMEIKFQNEFDIEIFVKGKLYKKTDYEEMGFYRKGTKDKKPDRVWDFLLLLSVIQETEEREATNNKMALSLSNKLNKKISVNNCEQIKSALSEKLQKKFGIEDNPFYFYKDCGYYKTKFKLRPLPIIRRNGEVFITRKNNYNDNIDYKKIKRRSGLKKDI